MPRRVPPLDRLAAGTALLTAAGFSVLARWRGARALHPVGTVAGATVLREGLTPGVGVPWLDEPGQDAALVRFSRATGLPAPLPDVLGLAIRVTGPDGRPQDLLLSSAGRLPVLRHVLQPRRGIHDGGYTSVLPFLGPSGPVMIGAFPSGEAFDLVVAGPAREWRRFGRLLLDPEPLDPDEDLPDEDLPDEDLPDEDLPDEDLPDEDLPDEDLPDEDPDPWEGVAEELLGEEIAEGDLPAAGGVRALRLEPVPEDARPDDLAPDDPGLDFDPVLHPIPGLRLPDPLARLRSVAYAASRRGRGRS